MSSLIFLNFRQLPIVNRLLHLILQEKLEKRKPLNSLPKTQVFRNVMCKYSIEWVKEEKSFLLTKTQYYTVKERKNIIKTMRLY